MADTVERPNTVAGLIEKRREIAGQIEHHQRILNELIIDLDHVDHTIRLFAPELDVSLAQPKQFPAHHAAFRGEMQRLRARRLRAATGPLTSLELAIEVVKGPGARPQRPARCEPHQEARRRVSVPPQGQGLGAGCGDGGAV
jgi:hypothetical protein